MVPNLSTVNPGNRRSMSRLALALSRTTSKSNCRSLRISVANRMY